MNNELRYIIRNLSLAFNQFRYSSYYPIVAPAFIILISLLLFGFFVLPHFQNWFSIQNEIRETQDRITVMQENSRLLRNMNNVQINEEYSVATKALPHERDFIGILQAIGKMALTSRIGIDDYTFSIGEVSKDGSPSTVKVSPITIKFGVDGTIDDINAFIKESETKLPIAKLESIEYSAGKAVISLTFYIKEFPDLKIIDSVSLTQLNQQDKELLNTLRVWSASTE